ncbi:hypothetical protein KA005_66250 [bacterium]|nr:hypothetical protein [bacterium]
MKSSKHITTGLAKYPYFHTVNDAIMQTVMEKVGPVQEWQGALTAVNELYNRIKEGIYSIRRHKNIVYAQEFLRILKDLEPEYKELKDAIKSETSELESNIENSRKKLLSLGNKLVGQLGITRPLFSAKMIEQDKKKCMTKYGIDYPAYLAQKLADYFSDFLDDQSSDTVLNLGQIIGQTNILEIKRSTAFLLAHHFIYNLSKEQRIESDFLYLVEYTLYSRGIPR